MAAATSVAGKVLFLPSCICTKCEFGELDLGIIIVYTGIIIIIIITHQAASQIYQAEQTFDPKYDSGWSICHAILQLS